MSLVTLNLTESSSAMLGLLATCRRLFLRDHEVWINIGVNEIEKRGEQRVVINIDLYVPLAQTTPKADRIDEVLDYNLMRRAVAQRVSTGHIHLLESLVDDLLRDMLAQPLVRAARVSAAKPDVFPDCEAVGVEVFAVKP
jgi:7,8-dihydroneopterin aldolase/epimerase/oxygenase